MWFSINPTESISVYRCFYMHVAYALRFCNVCVNNIESNSYNVKATKKTKNKMVLLTFVINHEFDI